MRKITTLLLVGLAFLYAAEGFAQRGIGTNLPNRSSVLHLESETRGLLIPRVALTETTVAAPINAPANSLLVYNTNANGIVGEGETGVRPGYYFWKSDDPAVDPAVTTGQWIPLLNTAGNNIEIDHNGVISVKAGEEVGEVLVTVDNGDGLTSEWISFGDFVKVLGRNGVTVVPEIDTDTGITTYHAELGGTLIKETVITAQAGDGGSDDPLVQNRSLTIKSGGNQFYVSDLNAVEVGNNGQIKLTDDTGDDGTGDVFTDTFDVLIVDDNGLVQRVNVADLLRSAIEVESGLHYDDEDGKIKLGGELTKDAEIILEDKNDFIITRGATIDEDDPDVINPGEFKVVGLEETKTANKIMVVDDATNTVKTVRRVISVSIDESKLVTQLEDYSPHVQEVNITVKKLTSDVDLQFPAIEDSREGQVINVRLDINEESKFYLNLKKDAGTEDASFITYGALPYQGWVLKFNGTEWLVVSSN